MSDSGDGKRIEVVTAGFCLLAVLGILALLYAVGLLNGEQSERRQNYPHAHSETAKQKAESACAGTDPNAVFECVVGYVEASEETAYTEQDLTAQQRAAWGTLIAAFAGIISVFVSLLGLYWIKGTLDATRVAANQATIATNAMVRQNDIAQSALDIETRPFVVPDGQFSHAMGGKTIEDLGKSWIEFAFINIGKAPAVILRTDIIKDTEFGPSGDEKNAASVIAGGKRHIHNGRSFISGSISKISAEIEYISLVTNKTYTTKAVGIINPPTFVPRKEVDCVQWTSVICEEKQESTS